MTPTDKNEKDKISEGSDTPSDGTPNQPEQQPSPAGGDQVADALHEEQEKGYRGTVPDENPNSVYTVAGVTKNKPEGK